MMRAFIAIAGFMLALAIPHQTQGQQQAFLRVDQAVWTDVVDRATKNYTHVYKSPVRLRQSSLWMQLRGSPELLEQMKGDPNGRVRIRHIWKKYVSDSVRIDHDQSLDVGRKEDLRKLSYEVDAEGFFRWRVWSDKVQLSRGQWRVDVVWESDEPVLCTSASGNERPCSFNLEVH